MKNCNTQKLDIVRIKHDAGFYSLESSWNQLLRNSSNNNPFLTWEWLYTWWSFYKEGKELCILLVKDDSEILAIAPLYLRIEYIVGIPIRFLRIMGDEEVCSEYLDIIVEQHREKEVYPLILEYLTSGFLMWDVMFFSDFFKDSNFLPFLNLYISHRNFRTTIRDATTNLYVPLPDTWDIYFSSLTKKKRKAIRNNLNRLSRSFDWNYQLYPAGYDYPLEQAMTEMMRLHEERWRTKKYYGVFQRKKFRSFHLKLSERFFDKQWLMLFFLLADHKALAALYGYKYGEKFYAYQMGFDPEIENVSPGNTTLLLSIKHAIELNLKEYDFLRGESIYKYGLTNYNRNNISIQVTPYTLKGQIAHFYHVKKPAIKAWFKSKTPNKIWKYLSDTKYQRTMKD